MKILKVSSESIPSSVAGAISGIIPKEKCVELQSVGAGALNQSIKAIAIARGKLAPIGIEIVCKPAFFIATIDDRSLTAIKIIVEEKGASK